MTDESRGPPTQRASELSQPCQHLAYGIRLRICIPANGDLKLNRRLSLYVWRFYVPFLFHWKLLIINFQIDILPKEARERRGRVWQRVENYVPVTSEVEESSQPCCIPPRCSNSVPLRSSGARPPTRLIRKTDKKGSSRGSARPRERKREKGEARREDIGRYQERKGTPKGSSPRRYFWFYPPRLSTSLVLFTTPSWRALLLLGASPGTKKYGLVCEKMA